MEYKRLGDYIREVNVRNRDLKVTRLLGVGLEKKFFPSIANIIGTDLSNYKVIKKGQFGCKFMSVGRDGILPVSILEDDEPAIISSAYYAFEVNDPNELLPEYLMMWLSRPEFDRELWFYSGGDVRGGVNYEAFCDMPIYFPSIERQREIVAEYETLTRRIRLNEQMIEKLEATAQALYRHTFVDNIDKQNLPQGWHLGSFTDVIRICGGGTPSTEEKAFWKDGGIPFYSPGDKTAFYYTLNTEKHITEEGLLHCSSRLYSQNTTFVTARGATTGGLAITGCAMAMNQTCYALVSKDELPFYVHQMAIEIMASLKNEAVGATFEALVTKDFDNTEIVLPPKEIMVSFNNKAETIYNTLLNKQQENSKITELQSLLLAKMGR